MPQAKAWGIMIYDIVALTQCILNSEKMSFGSIHMSAVTLKGCGENANKFKSYSVRAKYSQ
jgi:hypothetical protein